MSLDAARKRLEKAEKKSAAALVELHQAKAAFDEAFAAKFGHGGTAALKANPQSEPKKERKVSKNPNSTHPKGESEDERRRRIREYKRKKYAADKGRLLRDLSAKEVERAKAELDRLLKLGLNDVEIGLELDLKRPVVTQLRESMRLPGQSKGRPSVKTKGDGAMSPGQSTSDFDIPKKAKSEKRKAVKKSSAPTAEAADAKAVNAPVPAAESPTSPALEFRISPAEVEKASIEFPVTAEEASNHLGPAQTFPPELNLPGLVGRKVLKFFDGPRFQYLKANGVLEKIEGSYYCITKRP